MNTDHARFQQQKQNAISLHVLGDRPARGHGQHAQECGQHNQREADAVQPHEILNAERWDPRSREHVLHPRHVRLELHPLVLEEQSNRQHEREDGEPQRGVLNRFLAAAREKGDHQRAQRRQEYHQAQISYRVAQIHGGATKVKGSAWF
jgi:hypothetical protein